MITSDELRKKAQGVRAITFISEAGIHDALDAAADEIDRLTGVVRTIEATAFVAVLRTTLDSDTKENFRDLERASLLRSMVKVGMTEYPIPSLKGDPCGDRADGRCLCDVCGKEYRDHPTDWRVIGYGNVPFLQVLCDGRRVKL